MSRCLASWCVLILAAAVPGASWAASAKGLGAAGGDAISAWACLLIGAATGLRGARRLWTFFTYTAPAPREFTLGTLDHRICFGTGEVVDRARCPVCARAFAGESTPALMICNRCHVPAHAECWGYHGGCAIYGCRSPAP